MVKANCNNCKYCWKDESVGYRECQCEDDNFTEEELEKYEGNLEDGCPHFKEGENIVRVGYRF